MISERLEFLISQHADGRLLPADAQELEAELAESADARRVLEEYQELNDLLRRTSPTLPAIQWDRFAGCISRNIAADVDDATPAWVDNQSDESVERSWFARRDGNGQNRGQFHDQNRMYGRGAPRSFSFAMLGRRLALAAAILIAVGVGIVASRPESAPAPVVTPGQIAGVVAYSPTIRVIGPDAEAAAAPATIDISVGPSRQWTRDDEQWRYAQDVVEDPGVITIASAREPGASVLRN
jgi:anti-sigma factor RsiW